MQNVDTPINHVKPRLIQQSLEDITLSLQKERNILLWHDPTISASHNQKMYGFLSLFTEVKGFDDTDKLLQYVKESKPANFSVLTAGTKGEILTQAVSEIANVSAVYVFCGNVAFHSSWAQKYPKVTLVESDPMKVIVKIFADMRQRVSGHGSLRVDLPVFLENYEEKGQKEYTIRNSQFNRIIEMEDRILAQKDLLYLGKHVTGEEGAGEIGRFENEYMEYDMGKILKWYSESEVITRLASNCLKQGTSDALYYGRYLLKDLEKAINEQYWKSSKEFQGKVYRNIFITEEQWKKLKQAGEGKEISFVDFFRATKVKENSLNYLKLGIGSNILVTIEIAGLTKEQGKGLAELPGAAQEVLFSAFSRFTVAKINFKEVAGQDEERELVLGFGGVPAGQSPPAQTGIIFAQCMNCQSVLETGLDEFIDPIVHYTCNKCPKEHSVPVIEQMAQQQKVQEEQLKEKEAEPEEDNEEEEDKMKARRKPQPKVQESEPNHSLLSKEIDIGNLAPLESVFMPIKKPEEEKKIIAEMIKKPVQVTYDDDDEEEEEEEEEEEDEEQGRLLELYLKAKEEFEWKNYREAIRWYEEILKNPGKLDKVLLGKCYSNLNASYVMLGEEEKIVESLLKVLEEKKKNLGKDHVEVKAAYKELAQLFQKLAVE